MKLHKCKNHNQFPETFLYGDHRTLICKWIVKCTACKGINIFESKETIFTVIYSEEIDNMRKDAEKQWNQNN